jgi:hypothetical protein
MAFDDFLAAQAFDREGVRVVLRAGRGIAEKFLEEVHGFPFGDG